MEPLPYFLYGYVTRMLGGSTTLAGHFLFSYFRNLTIKTMKEKPTFYGIIPANVRYAKIADRAKLIFSEITAMSNKWGYCNASNGYFAQVWECDPSVISRHVSTLESIGAVRCVYIREGKQVKERRIYPLAMGGVLHQEQDGIAPDAVGVLHPMQGGIAPEVKDNTTSNNTTSNNKEHQPQKEDKPNKQLQFVTEVVTYLNQKTNQQFKTTTKETIQCINSRVKLDNWELEDFKAVIDFKTNEWLKDDKMRQYLCPSTLFRASNAEKYLLAAKASKPKPPVKPVQPTKVHVEERPVLTQHDIEYSQAAFAGVEQMFKQMGV